MISVTGIGIISAIGNNTTETVASLRQGRSGIGEVRYLNTVHHSLPVGEVKMSNDELRTLLHIPAGTFASRTTLLGVHALRQAIADAGLSAGEISTRRSVLISGTTVGDMDVVGHSDVIPQWSLGRETHDMATLCGLDVEVCTVSTACSSSLNAIILGCEMLRNGEADIVIAGGTEALSLLHFNGFRSLMILDSHPCRPFDATRAGLNLGEGAAYVVLQRSSEASRARAFVRGYANRCDAFHQTATSDNGEGAYLAMTGALRMAGLEPADIDYVNAHGTATPDNDLSESRAIRRVYGKLDLPISSTKGMTGHTTSASGSIETVLCILAMENGFIPQNVGWHEPMNEGILPYVGKDTVSLQNVMCNAFGFGGNDSSLVIGRSGEEVTLRKTAGHSGRGEADEHCGRDEADGHGGKTCGETARHSVGEIVSDVTIDNVEQLKDVGAFIPPMAARRMCKLMKAAMLTSLRALRESGLETPDAIVTATAYGMRENSVKMLSDLLEYGEETMSPTLFMQSTHNTIGSAIAIQTKCHGYNITYTQGDKSLEWALRDAQRLISTGQAENVLVGWHDETDDGGIFSRSLILRK